MASAPSIGLIADISCIVTKLRMIFSSKLLIILQLVNILQDFVAVQRNQPFQRVFEFAVIV
jgi:hypothetical protein